MPCVRGMGGMGGIGGVRKTKEGEGSDSFYRLAWISLKLSSKNIQLMSVRLTLHNVGDTLESLMTDKSMALEFQIKMKF